MIIINVCPDEGYIMSANAPRGASFTIGSLRRPSNPQGNAVEPLNQSQISPRVDLTRTKEWSGIGFDKQMILRSDIPPPPDPSVATLPHDVTGPPGLNNNKHQSSVALFVPSEGQYNNRAAVDYVPPPLKVKHFVQVSSLLKPLVETELLGDKTLFPLDWLPPPDDTPSSPRIRTGSSIV